MSAHVSRELVQSPAFIPEKLKSGGRWRDVFNAITTGIKRRWLRERRRRKVARAYDMALEIARVIPRGSKVLDVGCGNGFIAHHLSAMLGTTVLGIDLANDAEAQIDYRQYDGKHFPARDNSFDAIVSAYVLHHAQDVRSILDEMKRVLHEGGLAVIYEDIPDTWWDRFICSIHNRQWRNRTGACTFRGESEWRTLFNSFGFAIVTERRLSRWRNFSHPVDRRFYVLELRKEVSAATYRRPCVVQARLRPGTLTLGSAGRREAVARPG